MYTAELFAIKVLETVRTLMIVQTHWLLEPFCGVTCKPVNLKFGLSIKAKTLDLDEMIYFSVVDKSITGWDDE